MVIYLVHFRAVDLRYLEASLFSLSKQDLTGVTDIVILDNDTGTDPKDIKKLIVNTDSMFVSDHMHVIQYKHGDPNKRCHSWSVNECFRHHTALVEARLRQQRRNLMDDWVLFTRSDYILDFNLVSKFQAVLKSHPAAWQGFVTSYAYHMAYDERGDQRIIGFRDIEPTGWRQLGTQVLLDQVNGWKIDSSDIDAGVWMTRRYSWQLAGRLNERLKAWGLQQTVFQQSLVQNGVEIVQIPEFLFFHQHHGGEFRDYDKAIEELETHWGPRSDLNSFRNIENFVGKVNDETPRS